MKPRDKERLVKFRPALVRGLDVDRVLIPLRQEGLFTDKEEDAIMGDTRRREQVVSFLNILEKKKTETYQKFVEILEEEYPHLYLQLTDWENDADDLGEPLASGSHLDDEWSELHRVRAYLVKEIDAADVMSYLRKPGKECISESEEKSILRENDREKRTEALMDIIELKNPEVYDVLQNAIGDVYPHVYMALIGDACDDDDDW